MRIAVLITRDSPGGVFYRQARRGYNQREFMILKFRSMQASTEATPFQQATRQDARVTAVGRWLRRTNLDELPQLINVLRGEMSIVGPRPHAIAHDRDFERRVLRYPRRLNMKPGITGWAQVTGHRGETDTIEKMQARVEYDLEYLRNWSLGLDLQIIIRTVRLVFFDRNAY